MLFIKGGMHLLEVLREAEVDGISLDWRTSFTEARRALPGKLLQGQLDPVLLFASEVVVRERTKRLLKKSAPMRSEVVTAAQLIKMSGRRSLGKLLNGANHRGQSFWIAG